MAARIRSWTSAGSFSFWISVFAPGFFFTFRPAVFDLAGRFDFLIDAFSLAADAFAFALDFVTVLAFDAALDFVTVFAFFLFLLTLLFFISLNPHCHRRFRPWPDIDFLPKQSLKARN
jgi:hypothetical protein